MKLIKADFLKVLHLPVYRNMMLATVLLSILFSLIFLFTIGVTEGTALSDLSFKEVIDVTFLGIDAAAIMMIIFTALFTAKELSSGAIQTSLAITPSRAGFFIKKGLFVSLVSLIIALLLVIVFYIIDYLVAAAFSIDASGIYGTDLLMLTFGSLAMLVFYANLAMAGAFFFHSAAGGIAFSLSVMFLPALINMFPEDISSLLLPIFPQESLAVIMENDAEGSIIPALIILLIWMMVSSFLGYRRFKRKDY